MRANRVNSEPPEYGRIPEKSGKIISVAGKPYSPKKWGMGAIGKMRLPGALETSGGSARPLSDEETHVLNIPPRKAGAVTFALTYTCPTENARPREHRDGPPSWVTDARA